ncbi:ABC transporter substrate-binding protein [Amycolatopsis thermophila]|uniref:Peptide/nickel transport system substrate-binding protein n=1 Tax=Amycolatopsis thermophila TaxID=206084 RepID=A0ABU0F6D0_9PSEU|nr:ABC transporter substrate-binding protein [Amycolatopsis thermophila]MDQ0382671.1 peptide/nickel transport system substrate-binding protein [Amycolatopsis thermophila]
MTVLLCACGGNGGSPAGGAADPNATLRFGYTVTPTGLDPHVAPSVIAQTPYLFPLYDRLTQITAGPKLEPMVAKAWTFAPDGRSVTFALRDDVSFHDGTPLRADAVKASLDRALTLPASTVKSQLSMISAVTVVDPLTVRIDTNRSAPDLPYALSATAGSIINPKSIGRPDLDRVPDGSGPYVAESVRLGDGVTYKRAPSYWDPRAIKLAGLEIRGITNDNARLSALRSGEIDAMLSKVGQYDKASSLGPGFAFHSYPAAATYAIFLNTAHPVLDRVKVRQALNYAIDRDALNRAVLAGQCPPNGQPLTQVYQGAGYLPSPPVTYTHDVAKAKQLLAEAGVPDGFEMKMLVAAGLSPQDRMAPVVQAQLAEIGVKVTIDSQDAVQAFAMWKPGTTADAYLQTRTAGPTGAMTLRDSYLLPGRSPGPMPGGFADAVTAAFDAGLSADQVDHTLQTASTLAVEQPPDVFLCALPTQVAYRSGVVGMDSMGQSDFQGVVDLRYVGMTKR